MIGVLPPNALFTESRDNRMMVKTPSTVPNGINRHSQQAITKTKW
jgi:hypothetical protein